MTRKMPKVEKSKTDFVDFLKSKWVWVLSGVLWLIGYLTIKNKQARKYVRIVTFGFFAALIVMGFTVLMLDML